jgi:HNH endonuclease
MPVDEERLEEVRGCIETADRREDFLGLYMVLLQANREGWPDNWIAWAERAHATLVGARREEREAWRAFTAAPSGTVDALDARAVYETAMRRARNASRNWRRACEPERSKRRKVSSRVRKEVIAEWETAGRICGICRCPVGVEDAFHVFHDLPTVGGGSSDKENLRVGHARCNSELGDGTILHIQARERSSLAKVAAQKDRENL